MNRFRLGEPLNRFGGHGIHKAATGSKVVLWQIRAIIVHAFLVGIGPIFFEFPENLVDGGFVIKIIVLVVIQMHQSLFAFHGIDFVAGVEQVVGLA